MEVRVERHDDLVLRSGIVQNGRIGGGGQAALARMNGFNPLPPEHRGGQAWQSLIE